MKRIAIVCLSIAALGACARDDQATDASPSLIASPTQTPEPTPCSLEDATTDEKMSEGTPPFAPVTDVRQNASSGCPRVVFEFDGDQTAGYMVEYVEPPFSDCAADQDISTAGWDADAFLAVKLEPSASVDLASEGEETYTGPRDIALDGDILKHMKVTCDFEAHFDWLVGLDEKRSFTVTVFEGPPRLVIDISGA